MIPSGTQRMARTLLISRQSAAGELVEPCFETFEGACVSPDTASGLGAGVGRGMSEVAGVAVFSLD